MSRGGEISELIGDKLFNAEWLGAILRGCRDEGTAVLVQAIESQSNK